VSQKQAKLFLSQFREYFATKMANCLIWGALIFHLTRLTWLTSTHYHVTQMFQIVTVFAYFFETQCSLYEPKITKFCVFIHAKG